MKVVTCEKVVDTKLEKPFRVIVAGASGCGKTKLTKQLIDNNHFASPFDKIIYIYPDYLDEIPVEFEKIVEYQPGIQDIEYFSKLPKNTLLVFDDMMSECGKSHEIMKLFSVVARKKNISIIFLVQNVYDSSRQFRNIRLNATGFFLFNFYAANDVNQRLLRDLGLKNVISKKLISKIYSEKFKYIYIDIHPNKHSQFDRLRGNIFEENFSIYNQMEYIAIPKADFLKYFKIIEAKKGSIKAIKNEIAVKGKSKRKTRKRNRSDRFSNSESDSKSEDTESGETE
jgi:energy-coupling factor transporter ATP-binding protein EcfA2